MQHLKVLEEAELVIPVRRGRERWNHLNVVPIQEIHERWIGRHAAVELTIGVAPRLPTAEAHRISDAIEGALSAALGVTDTTIHVEPEDDS